MIVEAATTLIDSSACALGVASSEEPGHHIFRDVTALFDQVLRHARQRGMLRILRQAACADRLDVGLGDAFLECEVGVESPQPRCWHWSRRS